MIEKADGTGWLLFEAYFTVHEGDPLLLGQAGAICVDVVVILVVDEENNTPRPSGSPLERGLRGVLFGTSAHAEGRSGLFCIA